VHAINALGERYTFPEGVSLIDGGTKGLDLLPDIEGRERLMLIDAVDFRAAPGTIRVIEGADVKIFLDLKFSVHQIGVPDMLFAASFMGIMPPAICLVGIQPHSLEWGVELSPLIAGRMDAFLNVIMEKFTEWGIEPTEARA
jgi:hydrogenase maturation protease